MSPQTSSSLGDGHELMSEFLGQPFAGALLGLQDLGVVVRNPCSP